MNNDSCTYKFELLSDPKDQKSKCNDEAEIENLAFALLATGWEIEQVIEAISSFSTLPPEKIKALVFIADEKNKKRTAISAQQRNIVKKYEYIESSPQPPKDEFGFSLRMR